MSAHNFIFTWFITLTLLSFASGCKTPARLDFDLSPVNRAGSPVLENGGARLEKEFLLKACVADRFNQRPILNETFRIDGAEGSPNVATDTQGCVHWKEKIVYQLGEKNPYRILDRKIVGTGTVAGELALRLAIDPWRDLVIDTRFQSVPDAPAFVPSVSAVSFEYRYIGRRFELDRHLQLSQTREYRLTLTPRWHTPLSQANGSAQPVEIAEGETLRLAVVFASAGIGTLATLESRRFLSRYETSVRVNAHHQIVVPVPMRIDFPEEPMLDAGLEIFVELSPGEGRDGKAVVTSQQFEARKPAGGGSMTPETFSLSDLQALLVPREMAMKTYAFGKLGEVKKPFLPWQKSPYQMLTDSLKRAAPGLEIREVETLPEPPKEKIETASVPDEAPRSRVVTREGKVLMLRRTTKEELFDAMLPPVHRDRLGEAKPSAWPGYLARELEVMEELEEGSVGSPKVTDDTWQFTASFFHEASDFERDVQVHHDINSWEGGVMGFTSHSAEWGAGLKVLGNGVNYKGDAGVDARYGWWHRNQTATTQERDGVMVDKRNRVTLAEHRVLYSEERRFAFRAKVRKCLLLVPVAESKAVAKLYCRRETKPVSESWHYLADFDFRHDIPVERRDLRERMLIRLMRGRESYRRFKDVLQRSVREFEVRESSALSLGVNSLLEDAIGRRDKADTFFKDGGFFPGVIETSAEENNGRTLTLPIE